jgi:hypothetical protein
MFFVTLSLIACGVSGSSADAPPSAQAVAKPTVASCDAPLQSGAYAPLPALSRAATTLHVPTGAVTLPKSAALDLLGLAAETVGQPTQACVRHGDQVGLLPRADVLLLPAQAVALFKDQETSGSTVIVLEREAERVRVNSQSWFDPMPTIGKIGPDRLLYTPVEPALLLGDLPLDRWRPLSGDTSAGSGALEQPANVRGLTLPAGATLRWEEGGLWAEATLDEAGQVGGMALQAGDKLAFTQGCDVVLRRAGGREECFGLTDGALGAAR